MIFNLDSANKHQNLILFVSFPNNTLWIIGADMIKGATVRTLSAEILMDCRNFMLGEFKMTQKCVLGRFWTFIMSVLGEGKIILKFYCLWLGVLDCRYQLPYYSQPVLGSDCDSVKLWTLHVLTLWSWNTINFLL